MNTVAIILALITTAAKLLEYLGRHQELAEKHDLEVTKAALKLLEMTESGRVLRDKIAQQDDDTAARLWQDMVK